MEVGGQTEEVPSSTVDEKPESDQKEDVEDQILEIAPVTAEEEEEEVETVVDFDCPDTGSFPSKTNCAQYYQCTADRTVIITSLHLSPLSKYFGDRYLKQIFRKVTGY